jgi:hypothetical protein
MVWLNWKKYVGVVYLLDFEEDFLVAGNENQFVWSKLHEIEHYLLTFFISTIGTMY